MRLITLLVSGVMVFGAATAASADDASNVQSGWWNEAAVGPVIAPSTTQPGQLQVSDGFSGPLAISAVRFRLVGNVPIGSVTIRLNTTGNAVGTPAVSACPAVGEWEPGDDQPPAKAPGWDCRGGREAVGFLANGLESWTFPATWASERVMSVALIPSPGTTIPFSISFTAPSAASIVITPSAGQAPLAAGDSGSLGGTNSVPAPSSIAAPSNGSVSTPTSPGADTVPAEAAIPPILANRPGGSDQSSAAAAAAVAAPAWAARGGGVATFDPSKRTARALALGLLMCTGVVLFRLGARPVRQPRILLHRYAINGTGATFDRRGTLGGIGRFARHRDVRPTRI